MTKGTKDERGSFSRHLSKLTIVSVTFHKIV